MSVDERGDGRAIAGDVTVAALVVGALVAVAFVIVRAHVVMLTFFGAIVVGEAIRPVVDRLERRMPRAAAIALAFVVLLAAFAVLWLLPVRALAPEVLRFWYAVQPYLAAVQLPTLDAPIVGKLVGGLLYAQVAIAGVLSTLGLLLVMSAFWVASSPALARFVLSLLPPRSRADGATVLSRIGDNLAAYVGGTIVNGALVWVECTIILMLIRAPFPLVLGLVQGLLIALPYIGTLIGVLIVGGAVLAAQGAVPAVIAMLLVGLVQSLQGTFVAPLIFKRGIDIAPLTTVLAIAIGGALFGLPGVFLAVPAASVLQTLVVSVLAPALRSRFRSSELADE
jgi:predicted PurR-regulated permease PerM